MADWPNFSKRLRIARSQMKVTLVGMSTRLPGKRIHAATFSRWESGHYAPHLGNVKSIAIAYGIPPSELWQAITMDLGL